MLGQGPRSTGIAVPARDPGNIRIIYRVISSHHLPHPLQVVWHFSAPWISDKVTPHDIALTGRTAIWYNKWHETAWDNAGISAFDDSSETDDNASLVTDPLRKPRPNFPDNANSVNLRRSRKVMGKSRFKMVMRLSTKLLPACRSYLTG